jgi:hypothetical protein
MYHELCVQHVVDGKFDSEPGFISMYIDRYCEIVEDQRKKEAQTSTYDI